jgi:hypothetical protein
MVIVLAIGPKVHGFNPDREQNSRTFLAKFLPASLLGVALVTRAENSEG